MSLERLAMTNNEIVAQPAQETTSLAIKQSLCVCQLPDSDPKDHQTSTVTRWLCPGTGPSLSPNTPESSQLVFNYGSNMLACSLS